jgi:hypothetical protein
MPDAEQRSLEAAKRGEQVSAITTEREAKTWDEAVREVEQR